jgi:uridine kinase
MKPFIVAIGGGSGSGKTTVANMLVDKCKEKSVIIISMDNFYKSRPDNILAKNCDFDCPDAFDWDLFNYVLVNIIDEKSIELPRFCFLTDKRLEETELYVPKDIVIIEGILTLHDKTINELYNLKIFVEADEDVRLGRRVIRDTVMRGRTVDGVIKQYFDTVKPGHYKYIQPTSLNSDIVIPHNGAKNNIAVDIIASYITSQEV